MVPIVADSRRGDVLQRRQAVLVQLAVIGGVVRQHGFDLAPVGRRVVRATRVRQLVDDHVALQARRQKHERRIEHDASARGAAAPLRGREADLRLRDLRAIRFFVEFVEQGNEVSLRVVREERPQEPVERAATDAGTHVDAPTAAHADGFRFVTGTERKYDFPAADLDLRRTGAGEQCPERVDKCLFPVQKDQVCHTPEQIADMVLFFGSGEVFRQADNDGISAIHSPGMLVPGALYLVAKTWGLHGTHNGRTPGPDEPVVFL